MSIRTFSLAVFGLAGLLMAPLIYNGLSASDPPVKVISVDGSETAQNVSELRSRSQVVAIVSFVETAELRWNSADGKEWETDSAALPAMIYRDDVFQVRRVLRGNLESSTIVVRGVGGRIADTEFVYRDQPEWKVGREYLVLLRQQPTPFEGGRLESAWTLVSMQQGTFERDRDGNWRNGLGVPATESDLE